MINEAYIGLGSNLGDSAANMRRAVEMMGGFAVRVRRSGLYRTAPVGFRDQPAFYNAVCRIETGLTPFELMAALLRVETAVGRRRTFRNAPRMLDLDILLYGRRVMWSPPVVLPHPRMGERVFALLPLADIAPQVRHPVTGATVLEMLRALPRDDGAIVRVDWG